MLTGIPRGERDKPVRWRPRQNALLVATGSAGLPPDAASLAGKLLRIDTLRPAPDNPTRRRRSTARGCAPGAGCAGSGDDLGDRPHGPGTFYRATRARYRGVSWPDRPGVGRLRGAASDLLLVAESGARAVFVLRPTRTARSPASPSSCCRTGTAGCRRHAAARTGCSGWAPRTRVGRQGGPQRRPGDPDPAADGRGESRSRSHVAVVQEGRLHAASRAGRRPSLDPPPAPSHCKTAAAGGSGRHRRARGRCAYCGWSSTAHARTRRAPAETDPAASGCSCAARRPTPSRSAPGLSDPALPPGHARCPCCAARPPRRPRRDDRLTEGVFAPSRSATAHRIPVLPSDALALAERKRLPIGTAEDILDEVGQQVGELFPQGVAAPPEERSAGDPQVPDDVGPNTSRPSPLTVSLKRDGCPRVLDAGE